MVDKSPQADLVLVAQLTGEARHHTRWHPLTGDEECAAVTELRELARQAAALCRAAGADPEEIPAWIEEGRRRAASARMPPFSGGRHGGGARR